MSNISKAESKAEFKAKIKELHEQYCEAYANNRDVHFLCLIGKEIGAKNVMICTDKYFEDLVNDYIYMY